MWNRINFQALLCMILLASIVSSVPPFLQSSSETGFEISVLFQDSIRINQNYELDIHISNKTNGVPIYENVSCITHLYDSNGTHIYEKVIDQSKNLDYTFLISANNLTVIGKYPFFIACNNSQYGGNYNSFLVVTPLGLLQTVPQSIGSGMFLILMICLMILFLYIGMRLFENDNLWILGIFFVFFGILLLIYNTYLGYEYHRLFTGLPDSAVPERIFWTFLFVLVLGLLASAGLLFLKWKEVLRYIKKEIKRKKPEDSDLEDWDVDQWGNGNPWDIKR